jgi:hypothetical protein
MSRFNSGKERESRICYQLFQLSPVFGAHLASPASEQSRLSGSLRALQTEFALEQALIDIFSFYQIG